MSFTSSSSVSFLQFIDASDAALPKIMQNNLRIILWTEIFFCALYRLVLIKIIYIYKHIFFRGENGIDRQNKSRLHAQRWDGKRVMPLCGKTDRCLAFDRASCSRFVVYNRYLNPAVCEIQEGWCIVNCAVMSKWYYFVPRLHKCVTG